MSVKNIMISLKKDKLARSMILSTLCKPLGMVITLLYTPLLLQYLGNEKYGLWATILSIINWINYFDIGIGNGLRNLLSVEILQKKYGEIQRSVSTAYRVVSLIALTILLVGGIILFFINTNTVFNTSINLKPVIFTSFIFICINFVLTLCKSLLFSLQKAEVTSFMLVIIQFINLLGITMLMQTSNGNMFAVAFLVGASTFCVNLVTSKKLWKKYPYLKPKKGSYDHLKLKKISSVGLKFFFIQIASLVLFTTGNIIITNLFGPSEVTPYSITYSSFNIIIALVVAFMAPLWSKSTAAMAQKQYKWIRTCIFRVDLLLIPVAIVLFIATIFWKDVSFLWLGEHLNFPPGLIVGMGIYFFINCICQIYAIFANGMGILNLQLILGVGTAIINIPLSIFLGQFMGLKSTGVLLSIIICMLITLIPMIFYVHNFLNRNIARLEKQEKQEKYNT